MASKRKTKTDVLKDIKSGKYRSCYLIYTRKSTDETESQKNSISYQKSEISRFARDKGFSIAPITLSGFCTKGIISEKHSGFKEDDDLIISDGLVQYRIERPKFQLLLQYLNRGHFKGIICLCWDRISRNRGDDTAIRKLMRKGVDVRFVYATYDNSSAGELHMDIDGMFAHHHSRVTSEKVSATMQKCRSEGKCTHRAPIGYLNTGSMDHKPFDPQRAPIIAEMFELYATGNWSLSDIARHAVKQGLTTVPMRRRRTKEEMLADEDDEIEIEKTSRPITENHISRILTNQFYTGKVIGPDGTHITSTSHDPLVSDDLFNQVQAFLKKNTVSVHYTEKLDHPLRGFVRCAHCRRVYSPYVKKGILYFNARCVKGCKNKMKNCNFDHIAEEIISLISNLHFTDDELEELDARADTDISLLEEKRNTEFEKIERQKKRIREDRAYLRGNRLPLLKSGAYTPKGLVEELTKLDREYDALHEDEAISEEAMRAVMKEVIALSELIKKVVPIYDFGSPREKEKIARIVFSELFIAEDTLKYKVKKGFEAFEDRISAVSDPTAWLSELCRDRTHIQLHIQALEQVTRRG